MSLNSVRMWYDGKKKKELKEELLATLRQNLRNTNDALDLEGVDFRASGLSKAEAEKAALLMEAIQELVREHREYSIVDFSGGLTIVLTRGVEALPKELREFNERIGIIERGGK